MNTIADFQVSSKLWTHYLYCFCCYCNVSTYPFYSLLQVHHIRKERNHLSTETVGKKTLFMCNIFFSKICYTGAKEEQVSGTRASRNGIFGLMEVNFFSPYICSCLAQVVLAARSFLSSWGTDWLQKPKLISTGDTAVAFE